MFRLAEPMDEFYARAKREPEFRWVAKSGGGRLLRTQTVFEDVVKMICTTNCSWALTKIITDNLATLLGSEVSEGMHSFPEPAAIAAQTDSFMRKQIRCGYRAPFLLEFGRKRGFRTAADRTLADMGWNHGGSLQRDAIRERCRRVCGRCAQ